jgi:hypothetical protein
MSEMIYPEAENFRSLTMHCGEQKNSYHKFCSWDKISEHSFTIGKKSILRKTLSAVTLIELMIAIAMSSIMILAAGILLVSGQNVWSKGYNAVNKKIKQDEKVVMLSFGTIARKSNRVNYQIYKGSKGFYTPAMPKAMNTIEVVSGDAVELRYWDVELDASDSHNLFDPKKTATAYAFFYLDGELLKVDYGPYPPGAIPTGGGTRNAVGSRTVVLADHVTTDGILGIFSHTVENGAGKGCIRINAILTDPDDGEKIKVMTASTLRNVWPR